MMIIQIHHSIAPDFAFFTLAGFRFCLFAIIITISEHCHSWRVRGKPSKQQHCFLPKILVSHTLCTTTMMMCTSSACSYCTPSSCEHNNICKSTKCTGNFAGCWFANERRRRTSSTSFFTSFIPQKNSEIEKLFSHTHTKNSEERDNDRTN
jgi:hypothetical protein